MSMGGGPGLCMDISPAKVGEIWASALKNRQFGDGEGNNAIVMGEPDFHSVVRMAGGDDRVILTSNTGNGVRFVWNSDGSLDPRASTGSVSDLNVAHRSLFHEYHERLSISPV